MFLADCFARMEIKGGTDKYDSTLFDIYFDKILSNEVRIPLFGSMNYLKLSSTMI